MERRDCLIVDGRRNSWDILWGQWCANRHMQPHCTASVNEALRLTTWRCQARTSPPMIRVAGAPREGKVLVVDLQQSVSDADPRGTCRTLCYNASGQTPVNPAKCPKRSIPMSLTPSHRSARSDDLSVKPIPIAAHNQGAVGSAVEFAEAVSTHLNFHGVIAPEHAGRAAMQPAASL
jgi:hypothetical protein